MKVTYVGPKPEVIIDATNQVCVKGTPVEVSEEIGRSLLESPYWKTDVAEKAKK